VVNNAATACLVIFEEMITTEIERQFATNFYGVMHVMRAVLPIMRKQRSGHIINISSVASVVGLKRCAASGATKFAVEGLSLSVATEVEQFGIKITVVAPGFSRTDLLDARNVRWPSNVFEHYAAEGDIAETSSAYHGKQQVIRRSWARFWSKLLAWRTRRNSSSLEATPSRGYDGARGPAAGSSAGSSLDCGQLDESHPPHQSSGKRG
jgi:NAD(P)-dependent dehydrogenase (short-subunit alcohol dehydrogenase family)